MTARRFAAILSADIVGYSRLIVVDGVATLQALRAHRREVVDPAIAALGSGRTSNANAPAGPSSAGHRSFQPSSSGRKGPKFLKSRSGKLAEFRTRKGTHNSANCAAGALSPSDVGTSFI
jgi:hypothetical protein